MGTRCNRLRCYRLDCAFSNAITCDHGINLYGVTMTHLDALYAGGQSNLVHMSLVHLYECLFIAKPPLEGTPQLLYMGYDFSSTEFFHPQDFFFSYLILEGTDLFQIT